MQFEVILTWFWSDLWSQLWHLTSFCVSDWIFSILAPNHPQICNLKSFWQFEIILKWSPRSTFASYLFLWVRFNILNSNPRPSINMQFEIITTCFWSDLQGQLWPLTSFGGSDWMFSILTPNQPQICKLNSFWHVFEVIFKVNFGLLLLFVGQIEYSQF